jgi:leader peptidase (prepilin peptidase)/N-methyltransferase
VPAAIEDLWGAMFQAVVCGLVGLAIFMIMHVVYPAGMGMGDVKLAGIIGLVTGWVSIATSIVALMFAFFLSAIVSVVLLLSRRATMKTALPFGPFMLGGAILAIIYTAWMRNQFGG